MDASRWFRNSWTISLLVLQSAFGLGRAPQAADWPGLRGPHHDGIAVDEALSETWPAGGPPILWSRDLGQGYSSFAIVGELAYTQYQTALGQYVICLERDTGHTVWEYRVGAPYELVGIYPGPRSTPAVFDGSVYYTTPDGEAGSLDAQTGEQRWHRALQSDLHGDGTEFGYAASPIIADRMLFLPIGGPGACVVALSLPSGEVAWKSGSQLASYCSSYPMTLQGHPLLVSYLQNHLVIQDRNTGRQLWQTELSVGYDEHSAMPVYREPILIVSAPFKAGSTAYQLNWQPPATPQSPTSESELSVKQLWHQPKFSHDVDSSVVVGETLYGFDLHDPQSKAHRPSRGEFRAVNISDGQILWSSKAPGQANIVAAGQDLLLLNDGGELIRIRADREQYIELGRIPLFKDEVCWTPPALSSGVIIVRSQSQAIAIRMGPASISDNATTPIVHRPIRWIPRLTGLSALLLQGEREHPFMRPEREEVLRWYAQCVLVALLPLLIFLWRGRRQTAAPERVVQMFNTCLLATAILGVVATPILNRCDPDRFSFTWPLTLFAALQSSILAAAEATRAPKDWSRRLHSYLTGVFLVLTCAAYFLLLRQASLPHEWGFLLGLIPTAPFAIWAARLVARGAANSAIAGVMLTGFSAGFWGAVLAPQLLR